MSSVEIRTLAESDLADWIRAVHTGFLMAAPVPDEEVELRSHGMEPARIQGAWDEGRCVATFRSMPRELTVPGGAVLDADAITSVTVTTTHRRRGLLTRMMTADLAAAKERGETAAILIAAEYPIYGRFGFGPATWTTHWQIDVPRARLDRPAAGPRGRIDLVEPAEAAKIGPGLHDRFRLRHPGAINRTDRWWQMATGQLEFRSDPWKPRFFAVHRDADTGQVDGMAAYQSDDAWDDMLPAVTLTVNGLITTGPAAERDLWRYLLSVDWVTKVKTDRRPPDDMLPLLLGDARAARSGPEADFLWLRLLDTPRALAARTYAAPGTLVLDVDDPMNLAGGRFRLDVAPDGKATCTPTTSPADLTLTMSALSALYLGDDSATRQSALGHLTESHPGAIPLADLLFRTPRRPFCPDIF